MIRVGVLTSSRADYGIYLPLITRLKADADFELNIIAFGTHLSPIYGNTINQILADGFDVKYTIDNMLLTDSTAAIATSMGLTTIKFADFWKEYANDFDLVFCLGDRYEMFSAVMAGVPFQVTFAHLHGGETTLGAIDNVFRHCITLASKYHFVSTTQYAERVAEITGSHENIFHVGAMSLDNLSNISMWSVKEFKRKWKIDLSRQTILTTFHPETVNPDKNVSFVKELIRTILSNQQYQFLITMPNADTFGNTVRKLLEDNLKNSSNVYLIENLGSKGYFTAMKYSRFLLGNTSSGIIEAASFGKYVINLGDRQKGRVYGRNILHVPIKSNFIQDAINELATYKEYTGENIYFKSDSTQTIVNIVKNKFLWKAT